MSHCKVRTLVDQEDIIISTRYPTLQREDGPMRGTMAQMVRNVYYTMTSPCHKGGWAADEYPTYARSPDF